ncbi:hypothetical protein ZIOFF_035929 [Zingiber officinale]|uniref:Gag-pol polyprotein n=1 Tax=Zingiber officinale TaxID=94328 RepID=A0A8J5G9T6_ZINOF|nr:hypothetical protein ZIOFF_035929 [Zingiber officinale]
MRKIVELKELRRPANLKHEQVIMSMGNPIMSLLANNTLAGENFPKWKSNINIVLVSENNRFVLTEECPPIPSANAARAIREQYDRWIAPNNKAKAYMLASMSDALRSKMELKECAFEIMESLQEMFGQQSEQACHEATRKYTNARMILGTHVRDHVMQMTNIFSEVEMHGAVIDEGTQVSIILKSLPSDFIPFTSNYIMNKLNYGMTQLLNELQTFEAISRLVKNKAEANIVDKPNSSKDIGFCVLWNWMFFDYLWCCIDSTSFCDVLLYNVSNTGDYGLKV